LEVGTGNGGGSSSTHHVLFLANPCCSRFPKLENYISGIKIPIEEDIEKPKTVGRIMAYLWKADRYSSTYSFWRLENSLI
jgi:hypothetical protein